MSIYLYLLSKFSKEDLSEYYPDHTWIELSELSRCTEITGELLIRFNDNLQSLVDLENLTSVGGNLEIFADDAQESISGLENLTSVGEDLLISYKENIGVIVLITEYCFIL